MSRSMRSLRVLAFARAARAAGDAAAAIPCKFGSAWALPGPGDPGPVPSDLEVEGGDELQNPTAISIDLWFHLDDDVLPTTLVVKGAADLGGSSSYSPNHLYDLRSFVADPGAPQGAAASRGLFLHVGK